MHSTIIIVVISIIIVIILIIAIITTFPGRPIHLEVSLDVGRDELRRVGEDLIDAAAADDDIVGRTS